MNAAQAIGSESPRGGMNKIRTEYKPKGINGSLYNKGKRTLQLNLADFTKT